MNFECFSLENLTLVKNHVDLSLVFVLKTMATRWCPMESAHSRSDKMSVQLTDFY